MLSGSLLGAGLAAWQGYLLYGPNGIPAGLILGAFAGAVVALLLLGLLLLFLLAGFGAIVVRGVWFGSDVRRLRPQMRRVAGAVTRYTFPRHEVPLDVARLLRSRLST